MNTTYSNTIVMTQSNIFQTASNQSHLLPKVIYVPEQWSESGTSSRPHSVELEETLEEEESISAEVVPIESNSSSILATASLQTTSRDAHFTLNPSQESLTEHQDWLTLASKLRQQNQELIKTVVELEQALAESQHQLHQQKIRTRNAEILVGQQSQRLTKSQAQINQLTHELEKNQHLNQNQQLTLKSIKQQLESTQQHAGHLERECVFLQQDNNEKTQQLVFLEQQNQELRSRLHRQQRYTLQYKAALDQCLQLSQAQIENFSNNYFIDSQVRPIQPWSSHWQQLSSNQSLESTQETNCLNEDIEYEFEASLEVSLNEESLLLSKEKNITYTTDISSSDQESDTFLDEIFAVFDSSEADYNEPSVTTVSSNYPSPLITPISALGNSSGKSKKVDIPRFIR